MPDDTDSDDSLVEIEIPLDPMNWQGIRQIARRYRISMDDATSRVIALGWEQIKGLSPDEMQRHFRDMVKKQDRQTRRN